MKRYLFLFLSIFCIVGMLTISGCGDGERNYIVTFDANGGTGNMRQQEFAEGVEQALSLNEFTREGFVFSGWSDVSDGYGNSYSDGQKIKLTSDLVLYAQWKGTYTVKFNANGGTGTMEDQIFVRAERKALSANLFTRDNYEFVCWCTDPDGFGTNYYDSQEILPHESMELYAQWMAVTGTQDNHCFVDLGLPSGTKWATCNVGANSPIEFGSYYAWGETEPKDNYSWATYKYSNNGINDDDSRLTKYCSVSSYGDNGFTDNLTVLQASDDAAKVNWGDSWRMPTYDEIVELKSNCTFRWVTTHGVTGAKVTGPNGKFIFLPAADCIVGTFSVIEEARDCEYWSSTLDIDGDVPSASMGFTFWSDDNTIDIGWIERTRGLSVRPVIR